MQKNTKRKKRLGAILCCAVALAVLLTYLALVLLPVLGAGEESPVIWVVLALALPVVALVALILGVLLALRQRLKEIEGGEEEDAKQY